MDGSDKDGFSSVYLADRTEDNYQRFLIVPLITGSLGLLFIIRNVYVELFDVPSVNFIPFLATWTVLIFSSVVFRITFSRLKTTQSHALLDASMFGFATLMCFIAATLSALSSAQTSDFTAYAYTILGTATVYRCSNCKCLAIMLLTLLYFNVFYFGYLGHDFSLGFQLPIIALSVLSLFIARSLEQNRMRMTQLSRELALTNARLKEETIRDPLTKLYNRRYLADFIQREIKEFQRSGEGFCLALCDIDHFKKINDSLGHLVGDGVLIQFSDLLKQTSRSTDMLIRYGGEEFVIVMPRTAMEAAQKVIERTRAKIETTEFNQVQWSITASFGLTEITKDDTTSCLLARADHLLYLAKSQGRNRLVSDYTERDERQLV